VMKWYEGGDLSHYISEKRSSRLVSSGSVQAEGFGGGGGGLELVGPQGIGLMTDDKVVTPKKAPLPAIAREDEEQIAKWTYEMLQGLSVIHKAHLIHRDIKPANIFLDKDRVVKIGDFGVTAQSKTGRRKTVLGTPAYMAPEMLNQQGYDSSSDIYSLGCILFELLTLRQPNFQIQSLEEEMKKFPPCNPTFF